MKAAHGRERGRSMRKKHPKIKYIVLLALILFFGLFVAMIRRAGQFCPKRKLLNYIPLIILLVKSQAGQMLNSSYTMLAFSLAYLSMCQDFTNEQKN